MQWKNVKLIYFREMRDQLRDRRTLFLIAVLPLLLYPLLGMSVFQMTQFLQTHAGRVILLGGDELAGHPWLPPLTVGDRFAPALFESPDQAEQLAIIRPEEVGVDARQTEPTAWQALLEGGAAEAVVTLPPDFGEQLDAVREALADRRESALELPQPTVRFNSASDESKLAKVRVDNVLRRWRSQIVLLTLTEGKVPVAAAEPFIVQDLDVARPQARDAASWSKILPFVVFLWALTGAFYPAVDLCAGEKERGTLETLLTSPALRREIVWGKLLTVMSFSMATAALNLASMGVTGKFVVDQLNKFGGGGEPLLALPPASSLVWLAVALVPISALFSALCLACAALARSTKEGQYYLMPIMLVSMPLMMLPTLPGVELNLGNSLAPLAGVVLLLRTVIEGKYEQALPFVAPVLAVTLVCCLAAIRWAEEQFQRESVLFRESERLDLRRWLVHLVRDRSETPTAGQAAFCVVTILVAQFFTSVALSSHGPAAMDFSYLAKTTVISQLACVFAPAAIMTVMLTGAPWRTLLLDKPPRLRPIAAAAALALLLHAPSVRLLSGIEKLYPMREEVARQAEAIQRPLAEAPHAWQVLLLIAVLPPLCEELAFRGFILSGFRRLGHKWWAIGLAAIAFGGVHLFLQQKISAAALGLVIGYLAVQTGSLWPCLAFHMLHNGLHVGLMRWSTATADAGQGVGGWLDAMLRGDAAWLYQTPAVSLCLVLAIAVLWRLRGTPERVTQEEQLEEARHHGGALAV